MLSADQGTIGLLAAREVHISATGLDQIYVRGSSLADAFVHPDDPNWDNVSQSINKGTISGRSAYILGEQVFLREGATIDVSGDAGGGNVWIGGDYQGKNGQIENARYTWIDSRTTIDASAKREGSGGQVIVWADQDTVFHGEIRALGSGLGTGGFVEVSGKQRLDFQGKVDLRDQNGGAGMLLLDPVDVVIQIAGAGALVCGINTPGLNTTYDPATLTALLAGCNLTIQTSGGAAGNGDITVLAPVAWASAFTLTLDASRDILINANIQNNGTGGVTLLAPTGRTITIQPAPVVAGGQSAYVGSMLGPTTVGDAILCIRPHLAMTSFGGAALMNGQAAYLGFNLALAAGMATGPINVTCGDLTMLSQGGHPPAHADGPGATVIGHGNSDHDPIPAPILLANAPITVDAGSIHMQSSGGSAQTSIGHGGITATIASDLRGNICVTSQTDIIMDDINGGLPDSFIFIGHGGSSDQRIGASPLTNLHGDITVFAGNAIRMTVTVPGYNIGIGHFGLSPALPSFAAGNIFVTAGQDLDIRVNAPVGASCRAFIGHNPQVTPSGPIGTATDITSNLYISTGRDLNLLTTVPVPPNEGNIIMIGSDARTVAGTVALSVGGNLTVDYHTSNPAFFGTDIISANIGHISRVMAAVPPASTFVAVRGNLDIMPVAPPESGQVTIQADGDVNVAAGGFIRGSGVNNPSIFDSFISTVRPTGTTRIYAQGDITSVINPVRFCFFGCNGATCGASIDFRAGGSLTMRNDFTAPGPGPVILGATSFFNPNQLWTTNPNLLASVCAQPVLQSPLNPCPTCPANVVPLTFIGNSAAFAPLACGVFNGGVHNEINMPTGAITVLSPTPENPLTYCPNCVFCQTLNIGHNPVTDNIGITTVSADISILTFGVININQNIITAFPGFIDIEACNDLSVTGGFTISTEDGELHLAAGRGDLNLAPAAMITTTTGPICLTAFRDANLCPTITSNSGPITIVGLTGNINMPAFGVVSTLSPIFMVAGQNLVMGMSSSILSTASSVTIIVDNNHPFFAPIPPPVGFLQMDAGASITGTPLNIFTALQSANVIDASALFNGLTFVPGTLYKDIPPERWCTFIRGPGCPTIGCPPFFCSRCSAGFTIFYKDCLPNCSQCSCNASCPVMEFLIDLHPFNEFPGWVCRYFINYEREDFASRPSEPYYFRRRNLNLFNHPKSYTVWLNDEISPDWSHRIP